MSQTPALRPCPDCQHRVSTRAVTCPECGGPLWHRSAKDAFLSGPGLGVFDLIPGIRDLPYLARLALMALVVIVLVATVLPWALQALL